MERLAVRETFQYAGLAFMMELDGMETLKDKIDGIVTMKEICIS